MIKSIIIGLLFTLLTPINGETTTVLVYPARTTSTTDNVVIVTRTRGASTTTSSSSSSSITSASTNQTTAITECHYHESTQYCLDGNGVEGYVSGAPTTSTESAATEYTGCHAHSAEETYCLDPQGEEVLFVLEETNADTETSTSSSGTSCHFHAGVEHCVGGDESETTCERTDRDYNIPLRIGLLFALLATSAIGVFGPILVNKIFNVSTDGIIFVILKQFGTGIIISTAFVHLITHANLMWTNECLTGVDYEATGAAITMAGILLAFLVEYLGRRASTSRLAAIDPPKVEDTLETGTDSDKANQDKVVATEVDKSVVHDHHSHGLVVANDKISVVTMEIGIIFHSILIGITLVVAGDSFFITLFIVILFHQMFEGLALGSRITELKDTKMLFKLLMAFAFSIITPIGMAIGIGVLKKFNGNDKSTLIALATLDSFSAGVLIWTGVVEMWANDWIFGSLANASLIRTLAGFASLLVGMILMSVLGKWA